MFSCRGKKTYLRTFYFLFWYEVKIQLPFKNGIDEDKLGDMKVIKVCLNIVRLGKRSV